MWPPSHPPPYPPQGYPPPPYPPPPYPPPPPANPAMGSANAAIAIGAASLVLCCAPVGAVAAVFGVRAISIAKKSGSPTPVRAVVALVLAGLSLLFSAGVAYAFWADEHDRAQRSAAAEQTTKGKREGASLEPAVACALTEKALLEGIYTGVKVVNNVKCGGPYQGDARSASLAHVSAKVGGDTHDLTACFTKGTRWFVSSVAEGGAPCPTDLPPPPLSKGSDEALDKSEADYRATVAAEQDKRTASQAVATLDKVRDRIKSAPRVEKKCEGIDPKLAPGSSGGKIEIVAVDFDLLADPKERQEPGRWGFMSDTRVRTIANGKTSAADRVTASKSVQREAGPYLLVWAPDDRSWPIVTHEKTFSANLSYVGGDFDGWAFVVDTRSFSVACASRFAVHSSKSISIGRSRDNESGVMKELETDFRNNLYVNALTTLDKVSDGKLKLGTDLRSD